MIGVRVMRSTGWFLVTQPGIEDIVARTCNGHMRRAVDVTCFPLGCTADMLGALIGLKPVCPHDWPALFDWNSSPSIDASLYPSRDTL